ncbi:MAG: DUF721 domain-containing protein [Planctomycetaceae bacterium]|jgi:predicted nucleic acid-binding Zn ribbon protein|nr:DUF721 domain-containing protein [Planctomycetaceae bacterium]
MRRNYASRTILKKKTVTIGSVLTQLRSQKGFTQNFIYEEMERIWKENVGGLIAEQTRLGRLNRGILEVFVSSAVISQEISFRTKELTEKLNAAISDKKITGLKFTLATF